MPTWTVDDVITEIKDVAAFLGHKKATSGAEGIAELEESMQRGIIGKVQSLPMTATSSLALYKALDEQASSFSSGMKSKVKEAIDTALTQPSIQPEKQLSLKPQTIELPKYLTVHEWDILLKGTNHHAKVATCASRLTKLGLKSISEKTVKFTLSCLLCGEATFPEDPKALYKMVQDVKIGFASSSKSTQDLPFYVVYPSDPKQLPAEMLTKVYGHEAPSMHVPDQYPMIKKSVFVRKSKKEMKQLIGPTPVQAQQPSQQVANPSSSSSGNSSMPEMFMMFRMWEEMKKRCQDSPPAKKKQKAIEDAPSVPAPQPQLAIENAAPFAPKTRLSYGSSTDQAQSPQLPEETTPEHAPTVPAKASGKDTEEAAFQALKNKAESKVASKPKGSAKAKAKAKAKGKAKAAAMKRPASSMSTSKGIDYEPWLPEARWEGKIESWKSKHYHAARGLAEASGINIKDAKVIGQKASQKAKELYYQQFG